MATSEFSTPEEAEAAFYEAIETTRLSAMMRVWDDAEDIVCIHPLGPRAVGQHAVQRSWADILGNGAQMRFHIDGVRRIETPGLVIRLVQEHIRFAAEEATRAPILATNVYRLTDLGWRMILHHAAPQMRQQSRSSAPPRVVH
jgi:ketosteroid isomerase-like protein